MNKKTFIVLLLLAFAVALAYAVLRFSLTIKKLPIDESELIAKKQTAVKGGGAKKQINSNSDMLTALESEFARIASPFDTASPFSIKRIWVEGGNFFVEYQNGENELNQLLVQPEGSTYKAKALFVSSESGWSLVKGEGNYVDPSALLYEQDSKGEWIKKN